MPIFSSWGSKLNDDSLIDDQDDTTTVPRDTVNTTSEEHASSSDDDESPKRQRWRVVYESGLNAREKPSLRSDVAGMLKHGDIVKQLDLQNGFIRHRKGWTKTEDADGTMFLELLSPVASEKDSNPKSSTSRSRKNSKTDISELKEPESPKSRSRKNSKTVLSKSAEPDSPKSRSRKGKLDQSEVPVKSKPVAAKSANAGPSISVSLDPDRKKGLHRRNRSRSQNDLAFLANFSDPFAASANPFATAATKRTHKADPFAVASKDPFATAGIDDKHSNMAASAPDAFSDPFANSDPFASSPGAGDPFASSPATSGEPFAAPDSEDPFADAPASLKASTYAKATGIQSQQAPMSSNRKPGLHRRNRSRSHGDLSALASFGSANKSNPFAAPPNAQGLQGTCDPFANNPGIQAPGLNMSAVNQQSTLMPYSQGNMTPHTQSIQAMTPIGPQGQHVMGMSMSQMGMGMAMSAPGMSMSAPGMSMSAPLAPLVTPSTTPQLQHKGAMSNVQVSPDSVLQVRAVSTNPFDSPGKDTTYQSRASSATTGVPTAPSADIFEATGEKNPFSLVFLSGAKDNATAQ